MTTLPELRAVVRTQTQTDPADLPDQTIDVYLQQAFERTLNGETRWPFYAQTWELVQEAGESTMTLAGDVNVSGIMTLAHKANGYRLEMVPQEYAEDLYATGLVTGWAAAYSIWGTQVYLWPAITHTEPQAYRLRGYRRPLEWLTIGMSPDCDPRLHLPLTHYAVALAYAQQEDEVLEATYMARWQADVELAHRAIMDPLHHRPLIGGGSINRFVSSAASGTPSIAILVPTPGDTVSQDEVMVSATAPVGGEYELWVDTDEEAELPASEEVHVGSTAPAPGIELWVDTSMD